MTEPTVPSSNSLEALNFADILIELLTSRKYLWERIFFIISILASFSLLVYETYKFSCQLSFVQNAMIPFILAFQITNKLEIRELGNRILVGVFVGGFTGGLPALLLIVIDTIEYYLLGDRDLAASVLGNSPPQLTLYTFSMSIVSTMSLWITLLIVSSLVGLVAGVISGNKRFRPS